MVRQNLRYRKRSSNRIPRVQQNDDGGELYYYSLLKNAKKPVRCPHRPLLSTAIRSRITLKAVYRSNESTF